MLFVLQALQENTARRIGSNQFITLTNQLAEAMKVGAVLLLQQPCSHWSGVKITREEMKEEIYAQAPIAWTPPSTWMISPVVLLNQSESKATAPWAAGTGSVTSH